MSIKQLREVLNVAGSQIDDAIRLVDQMTLLKGSELFDKHIDSIRNTINKIYIDLAILNTKALRAAKFEPILEKDITSVSENNGDLNG